jgi:hypothetical protein
LRSKDNDCEFEKTHRHFHEQLVLPCGKKSQTIQSVAFTSSIIAWQVEIVEMSRIPDMTVQLV